MNDRVSPPSPGLARRNRLILLILAASFIVPFLVGDLAYRFGWYKGGQVNKGLLIDPPASLDALQARDAAGNPVTAAFASKSWWLVYVVPAECELACRNRLFQMRQVRKALGKEAERLRQVLVFTAPPDAALQELLAAEFSGFERLTAEPAVVDTALARATSAASRDGRLYVMDPMGWLMLAYLPEADEKASVVQAEDVLHDLRKLLKASRIG